MFYDEYTEVVTMLNGRERTVGWPATVGTWSLWLGVAIVICLPMMIFMQDWRNPSLGLTKEGLFINQQMIRNTLVPFDKIASINPSGTGEKPVYEILFNDNAYVVGKQIFLFRPFVKSNLTNGNFHISQIHTAGDIPAFFEEVKKRMGQG
jgi:hypothetical protein